MWAHSYITSHVLCRELILMRYKATLPSCILPKNLFALVTTHQNARSNQINICLRFHEFIIPVLSKWCVPNSIIVLKWKIWFKTLEIFFMFWNPPPPNLSTWLFLLKITNCYLLFHKRWQICIFNCYFSSVRMVYSMIK